MLLLLHRISTSGHFGPDCYHVKYPLMNKLLLIVSYLYDVYICVCIFHSKKIVHMGYNSYIIGRFSISFFLVRLTINKTNFVMICLVTRNSQCNIKNKLPLVFIVK